MISLQRLAERIGVSPGRLAFQAILLAGGALASYVLAPELLALFSAAPVILGLDWVLLAFMVMTQGASLVFLAALVREMLPQRVAWSDVLLVQLAANGVALSIPGGAAVGGAAAGRLLVRSGAKAADTAAALAASSLLSTLTIAALAPIAGALSMWRADLPPGLELAVLIGTAMAVTLLVAAAVVMTADWPLRAFAAIGRGLDSLLLRHIGLALDASMSKLRRTRSDLRSRLGEHWRQALAFSAANWLLDFATLGLALVAVDAGVSLGEALLAFVAVAILRMIPITPGGLGFVEGGLTSVLTIAGMPALGALVVTLAYRAVSLWLALPAAAIAYVVHRRRHPATSP